MVILHLIISILSLGFKIKAQQPGMITQKGHGDLYFKHRRIKKEDSP